MQTNIGTCTVLRQTVTQCLILAFSVTVLKEHSGFSIEIILRGQVGQRSFGSKNIVVRVFYLTKMTCFYFVNV